MTTDIQALALDVDDYRNALRIWLHGHRDELIEPHAVDRSQHIANGLRLTRTLWQAGWKRV